MTFELTVSARIPRPAFDVVVELKADPGSVLAVVGPNGAGKSSAIAVSYTHLTLPTKRIV